MAASPSTAGSASRWAEAGIWRRQMSGDIDSHLTINKNLSSMSRRVFVSSTHDLIDLRAEVAEHIRQLGLEPVLSESPEAPLVGAPMDAIRTCLVNIDACDVFVCVLSQRYGSRLVQDGFSDNISATHLEYRRAQDRVPCPRILFYIRDQLLAAYEIWVRANRPSSPGAGAWLKYSDDPTGLFELIDEHLNPVTSRNRSTWRDTFRDSVQLRRLLTKQLAEESAVVLLERLAENGQFPELAISWGSSNLDKIFVRNVGNIVAHDVEFVPKGMTHQPLRLSAIEPGFGQWLDFSIRGSSNLIIHWRDSAGRTIADIYQLIDGKAVLHARRLLRRRSFHLLGPTEPVPDV
jgi:hypothetical protein